MKMANTFTQIYIHFVFAVQNRALINSTGMERRIVQIHHRDRSEERSQVNSNKWNGKSYSYFYRI